MSAQDETSPASSADEIKQTVDERLAADRRVRTVVIAALGMSVVVWELTFNLGAHRAFFFARIHWLWVVVTTVAICLVVLRRDQTHVGWRGLALLTIPSSVFLVQLARAEDILADAPIRTLIILLIIAAYAAALPYAVYVIANIIDRDLIDLSAPRVRVALVMVAIVIGVTGFFVGDQNHAFLVCEDFTISGSHTPDNCREAESDLILK